MFIKDGAYLASVICYNIVYALWKLLRWAQNLMLCESYCLCFWQVGWVNNNFQCLGGGLVILFKFFINICE